MKHPESAIETPWYQNGYVWLLISFPLSAVLAGFYTLYLAIISYDGLVVDDYYKQGLAINKQLARLEYAKQLGLNASLQFEPQSHHLIITLDSTTKMIYPNVLQVTLSHSTRQGFDQTLQFHRANNSYYTATLEKLIAGNWNIAIEDKNWRIDTLLPIR